jgi:hypothetical protein
LDTRRAQLARKKISANTPMQMSPSSPNGQPKVTFRSKREPFAGRSNAPFGYYPADG